MRQPMSVKWIKTDKHVYGAIYREHYKQLKAFGTCTCPEGDPRLGKMNPYILTEWGFDGADDPIIKSIGEKETFEQKDYDYQYYIALTTQDEACDK